jgi:hypothetical protein
MTGLSSLSKINNLEQEPEFLTPRVVIQDFEESCLSNPKRHGKGMLFWRPETKKKLWPGFWDSYCVDGDQFCGG